MLNFGLIGGTIKGVPPVDPGQYIFYEYVEFLALPERQVVDTGTLYPNGYNGAMKSCNAVGLNEAVSYTHLTLPTIYSV